MRALRTAGTTTVLLAAALLAGCGSGGGGGAAATSTPAAAPPPSVSTSAPSTATTATPATTGSGTAAAGTTGSPGGAAGTTVPVTATEFAFALPTTHVAPGTYTFVLTNRGTTAHAMAIEGGGVDEDVDPVGPGGTASLTVTLPAGSYDLYCPVDEHQDKGMDTTITVG
jgi:plastocyanin